MSSILNRLPSFLKINNKENLKENITNKNPTSDTQKPEPLQALPTEEPVSLRELGKRFKIGFDKIHIPQGDYFFSKTH